MKNTKITLGGGLVKVKKSNLKAKNFKLFRFSIFFSILLGSFLMFGIGKANGADATCYVSPTGSNSSPYDTWAKAANLPSTVYTYLATTGHDPTTGHTIFIAPGTYDNTMYVASVRLTNSLWQGTANNTCADTSACLSAKAAKNQIIWTNTTAAKYTISVTTATGVTFNNMSITNTPTKDTFRIELNGGAILNDIRLYDSPYTALYLSNNGTVIANRLLLEGAIMNGIQNNSSGTAVCNYCTITDSISSPLIGRGVYQVGTGSTTLNNNIINNSQSTTDMVRGDAGVFNINNSILGPTFIADTYIVYRAGGTVNLTNNILLQNYHYIHRMLGGTINTDTGNIKTDQPRYVHRKRSGIIVPTFDDSANAAYVYSLIDTFKSRGKHATFYIDEVGLSGGGIHTIVENIFNDGTIKLAAHSYSHTNLTLATPFSVTKAESSISIDRATDTITVGPTTGFPVGSVSLTPFKNQSMTAIRTWLSATAGITNGALTAGQSTYSKGEILDTVTAQSIDTAFALPILKDTTLAGGLFKSEVLDTKTSLQSIFAGLTIGSYSTPYEVNSTDIAKSIKVAGYLGNRVGWSVSNGSLLKSIDVNNLAHYNVWLFITDASATDNAIKTRVRAICEWVAQSGNIIYLLSHNTTQSTVHQWGIILDTIAEYSEIDVMDSDTALNTIRSGGLWANGSSDCDDGGATETCTWTRTWTDSSNFHLQSSSPAIDAGTNVSLTSDTDGNKIYGTPDIGGYEYQPPHDMAAATPDDPQIGEAIRVYGDGKFRNTIDDSSENATDTAKLSVVPENNATTKWLDLNIAAWNNSGTYQKLWSENSTNITGNVNHTVGDLEANKYYSVYVDSNLGQNITGANCTSGVCLSDETGKISFTYTGGYSEHTFLVEDATPPTLNITSPEAPEAGDTVSSDDTITFTDTEETDPECSIDNTNWINCTSTVTSFNGLIGWNDIEENDTFTLYMRDTDGAGNTGTDSVSNLTKADTQAPIRSNGSPSGELSNSTTETTISLNTSESAVCKYSTTEGTAYGSMTDAFDNVDGTTHTATVSGLSSAALYNYYVRCQDESENANDTDYLISFSVASALSNDENTDENNNNERDLNVHSVKAESTENSITLTWKTDHNTKSSIRYGTDRNLKEKKKDNQKEKKHKAILKDLLPNTKYYFRIKATDSDDNEDSSSIHSIMTKSIPTSNSNLNTTSNENTNQTPTPTENTATPSYSGNPTPNVCSYTVESGDTLWSIAKKVYGDATAYTLIIDKNKDKYTDIESKLSIGQELTFCDNDQNSQTTGNNSNTDNTSQQNQPESQPSPPAGGFHWWNPFSWF